MIFKNIKSFVGHPNKWQISKSMLRKRLERRSILRYGPYNIYNIPNSIPKSILYFLIIHRLWDLLRITGIFRTSDRQSENRPEMNLALSLHWTKYSRLIMKKLFDLSTIQNLWFTNISIEHFGKKLKNLELRKSRKDRKKFKEPFRKMLFVAEFFDINNFVTNIIVAFFGNTVKLHHGGWKTIAWRNTIWLNYGIMHGHRHQGYVQGWFSNSFQFSLDSQWEDDIWKSLKASIKTWRVSIRQCGHKTWVQSFNKIKFVWQTPGTRTESGPVVDRKWAGYGPEVDQK